MVASQISQEAIDFVTENESNMKEFIAFSKSFHEQCGCLSNSCKMNTFITSLSNFFEKNNSLDEKKENILSLCV